MCGCVFVWWALTKRCQCVAFVVVLERVHRVSVTMKKVFKYFFYKGISLIFFKKKKKSLSFLNRTNLAASVGIFFAILWASLLSARASSIVSLPRSSFYVVIIKNRLKNKRKKENKRVDTGQTIREQKTHQLDVAHSTRLELLEAVTSSIAEGKLHACSNGPLGAGTNLHASLRGGVCGSSLKTLK